MFIFKVAKNSISMKQQHSFIRFYKTLREI